MLLANASGRQAGPQANGASQVSGAQPVQQSTNSICLDESILSDVMNIGMQVGFPVDNDE
jgi:hypothetical protein